MNRREFLGVAAAMPAAVLVQRVEASSSMRQQFDAPKSPVSISSGNGAPAVKLAYEMIAQGADPIDAIVAGVKIVEDDPNDTSVGYGGLPNEGGVVELDASVMHGPTHKAGAVAAIQNIKNPAAVALQVMRQTDHVLLVGEGAYRFARAVGFPHEELLTERAREEWLKWKANLSPTDDWLNDSQRPGAVKTSFNRPSDEKRWGTIHCAAVNTRGELSACTSTSGLAFKLPGRVGDSPIVGAGMFVDNDIGTGGSTGRGEAVIQSCGAFQVVRNMADGDDPTTACMRVIKWIAAHTKLPDLLNEKGEPNFQVTMYALRKDGAYGAACIREGGTFTVHDSAGGRTEQCAYLFE
jgi:N4-(beta-N-acetylglucosaminyl)-L-asparaginase